MLIRHAQSNDSNPNFLVHGQPVFVCAFAVEKKGSVPAGLMRVTRLIMHCVTNAYLCSLGVDLKTLGANGWCSIVIWNGCYIIWCSDDMNGACLTNYENCRWEV